jgi:hypothetical protein
MESAVHTGNTVVRAGSVVDANSKAPLAGEHDKITACGKTCPAQELGTSLYLLAGAKFVSASESGRLFALHS